MNFDKTILLRQLIPKSISFLNIEIDAKTPFFSNNYYENYQISKCLRIFSSLIDNDILSIDIKHNESYSYSNQIRYYTKEPCKIFLIDFISKLNHAYNMKQDYITIPINVHRSIDRSMGYFRQNLYIYFDLEDVKEALAMYYGKPKIPKIGYLKESKKDLFSSSFEFGLSKDPNIVSTFMGVAIKNDDSNNYSIFDNETNTITNISNINIGNFPIILLPVKELFVGDLIKRDSSYYYVKEFNLDGTIVLLEPSTGEIKTILLSEHIIPGMNFYTKVIAIDMTSLTNPISNENLSSNILAAIFMLNWSNPQDTDDFSFDSLNDNSFNGLGKLFPLLIALNNNSFDQNSISNLILLGCSENTNQTIRLLILSQLLNNDYPNKNLLALGNSTKQALFCSTCGTKLNSNSLFCHICGKKVK